MGIIDLAFGRSSRPSLEDEKAAVSLWPIRVDGKWGYIDIDGNKLIPLTFDFACEFHEGLAGACVGSKWGFIDKTGQWVVPPEFDEVEDFSEGLAQVCQNDNWGYIDGHGNVRISLRFRQSFPFKEGLASTSTSGELFGYIDPSGQTYLPERFEETCIFGCGKAGVRLGGSWGYINRDGSWFIRPCFEAGGTFKENIAYFSAFHQGRRLYNYVDTDKRYICSDVTRMFTKADYFSEGLAFVSRGNKHGYIDHSGEFVIPPQFDDKLCSHFSEGFATVKVGDKCGIISKGGQFVAEPQFRSLMEFRGGLATEGLTAYVNTLGKSVQMRFAAK